MKRRKAISIDSIWGISERRKWVYSHQSAAVTGLARLCQVRKMVMQGLKGGRIIERESEKEKREGCE